MKIIIIGAKGFIGQHCVRHFTQKGKEVWQADIHTNAHHRYYQLTKEHCHFEAIFEENSFDVCINASGSAHVGFSFESPEVDFELNVHNVNKLLVAIRKHNPTCKFINFSSAAVYGNPSRLPIAEDFPTKPLSPYGFHKLQSEYLLAEYHKFFGLHTCSLRVFSAYGDGLTKQLFWDLYQKTLQQDQVALYGTGEESRDFIFINDLVQIIELVIEKAAFEGDIFNVACGQEIKIKEAVQLFFEHFCPNKSFLFSGKQKIGDPNNWQADISKIKALGFTPVTTLKDGLKIYTQWLREKE
ncbi:MAG: NAD-dependent epimerase/dehydratase family protein [Thermonemataceae bacterium]